MPYWKYDRALSIDFDTKDEHFLSQKSRSDITHSLSQVELYDFFKIMRNLQKTMSFS